MRRAGNRHGDASLARPQATWGDETVDGSARPVALLTDVGELRGRYHSPDGMPPEGTVAGRAVLWVFGAGGGFAGPAGGIYERLGRRLARGSMASLQLDYRHRGDLDACVLDVAQGIGWLCGGAIRRVALVGHSFGGAVVITAGADDPRVSTVVALSSQTHGTSRVAEIAPRPLLLVHGSDDEVLPASCSTWIHHHAREPKRLILHPGARHGLDACRDDLDRELEAWLETFA